MPHQGLEYKGQNVGVMISVLGFYKVSDNVKKIVTCRT